MAAAKNVLFNDPPDEEVILIHIDAPEMAFKAQSWMGVRVNASAGIATMKNLKHRFGKSGWVDAQVLVALEEEMLAQFLTRRSEIVFEELYTRRDFSRTTIALLDEESEETHLVSS